MKELSSIRPEDWLTKWPVVISLLLMPMSTEVWVIPVIFIGKFYLHGLQLGLSTAAWATGELIYSYWFSGWTLKEIAKSEAFREGQTIGEDALEEVKRLNIFSLSLSLLQKLRVRAEHWVYHHVIEHMTPDRREETPIIIFLKESGVLMSTLTICALGIAPIPFVWIEGLLFCRVTCRLANWRTRFATLVLGNAAKNFFYAMFWDHYWGYRWKIFQVFGAIAVFLITKYIFKLIQERAKKKRETQTTQ